jgi:hypothetical protein
MNNNLTPHQMRHTAMAPDGLGKPAPSPHPSSRPRPLAPGPRLNSGAFTEAPPSSISPATPVTHLAQKPRRLRHKMSDRCPNPLKERHLQRHE